MSIVASKSKKIVRNAIYDLSKKEESKTMDIQLLVKYHEGRPEFFGLKDFTKNLGYLPLHTLYPTRLDIFGIRNQIPVFIANLINDLSEKNEIPYEEINIIISGEDDSIKKLNLHAYHNGKHLKMLSLQRTFYLPCLNRLCLPYSVPELNLKYSELSLILNQQDLV